MISWSYIKLRIQQIWQEIMGGIAYVFPAQIKASPVPGTNTVAVQLVDIITAYNRAVTVLYPRGIGPTIAAIITKNTPEQNKLVADTIKSAALAVGINEVYLASVINQESCFGIHTVNFNISATNPASSFQHTDWGIGQFSGFFLPSKSGMEGLTQEQMEVKVLDPTWAIPMMAQTYAGNIAAANKNMSTNTTLASSVHVLNTTTFTDAEWLAALYYNRGVSGGNLDVYTHATSMMAHPYHCATWYAAFNKALAANSPPVVSKEWEASLSWLHTDR